VRRAPHSAPQRLRRIAAHAASPPRRHPIAPQSPAPARVVYPFHVCRITRFPTILSPAPIHLNPHE
jgi:hypothetical protein